MPGGSLAPRSIVVAYLGFACTWAIANPPFAAPDEAAHYLRVLGVANGEVVGRPAAYRNPAEGPEQAALDRQLAREVTVPAGLLPNGYDCFVVRRTASAACQNGLAPNPAKTAAVTYVGTYQPLSYLLPALTVGGAHEPGTADRVGRLTELVASIALLAAAVWLLWAGTALSLLGTVVAVTPMVIFAAASMGGSGLEITAAICFAAAMLRLARDSRPTGGVWAIAGVSGTVLASTRALGPAWVVLDLLLLLALVGRGGMWQRLRSRPRAAAPALGAIAGALLFSGAWMLIYGPSVKIGFGPIRESMSAGGRQYGHVLKESVGVFGYLDLDLPVLAYVVWAGMTAALLAAAVVVAQSRERRVLAGGVAMAVVLPVVYYAGVARHGISLQGRHMLPLLVAVPLLAGEIVLRNRRRLGARTQAALLCTPIAAAGVQLLAWYVNARRAAVGTHGPFAFFNHAQWQPPGRWAPWIALAVVAAAVLATTAVFDRRERKLRASSPAAA